MNLYLTADLIGTPTGGGLVTAQELRALQELGETQVVSRRELEVIDRLPTVPDGLTPLGLPPMREPWLWDLIGYYQFGNKIKLAHIYSGTFSESVKKLKVNGAKVVYTIAAHSIETSRREHEKLGIPYAQLYPHLCETVLWRRYSAGYFAADHIVCPSTYSRDTVQSQATALGVACPPITVIPHGCYLPDAVKPLPKRFTVGYMGAYGADKGVIYLITAWKKLAYPDATLVLAGKDSTSDYVKQLVAGIPGGGNIELRGWVDNVSDFYNSLSLYVQPSATEGFGIEVLEALAHGKCVICSDGAGVADVVRADVGTVVVSSNVEELAEAIVDVRGIAPLNRIAVAAREVASEYTWNKIRQRYIDLWKEVLKT